MISIALILISLLLASSWWLFRERCLFIRVSMLLLFSGCLLATPWLPAARAAPVLLRGLQMLACCAVLTPKLLDAFISPSTWHEPRFRDWLAYLVNPFVLVYRAHLRDPAAPLAHSIRQIGRGALSMIAGATILYLSSLHDFRNDSFWIEHTVKTIGAYLFVLDGQFVVATGLNRILTGRSLEFSLNPILAHSPADFWRRYNRSAGRFLHLNIAVPLIGKRSLLLGIAIIFIVNGIFHEYLAWVMSGRLLGYQIAFFGIQGAATILTLRWRPQGGWRVVSVIVTFAFNLITSALFFASFDLFVNWYDADNPLAW